MKPCDKLTDEELKEKAIKAGVSPHKLRDQMRQGVDVPPGNLDAELTGEGGQVLAQTNPKRYHYFHNFAPMSRLAQMLTKSKDPQDRRVGKAMKQSVAAARHSEVADNRYRQQFEKELEQGMPSDMTPREANLVREALQGPDPHFVGPSEKIPKNVREGAEFLHDTFRRHWRMLGKNEHKMMGQYPAAVLDQALKVFPEGVEPDFINTPINKSSLIASAARAVRDIDGYEYHAPQDRAEWDDLYDDLVDLKKRVQKPVFLDAVDANGEPGYEHFRYEHIRRVHGMIQGRGGIEDYFPHVWEGVWKVEAGPHSTRFQDRGEAVQYAQQLLDSQLWTEDIPVTQDTYLPDSDVVYIGNKQYQKMKKGLQELADEESVVVAIGENAKIRVKTRRQHFAHAQKREFNLQTYIKDPRKAIQIYNRRLSRKLAYDPFRKVMDGIITNAPKQGNWKSFFEQYQADILGIPRPWVAQVDNFFNKITGGKAERTLAKSSGAWRTLMSVWHLGFNPMSPVINLTQTIVNTPAGFEKDGWKWTIVGAKALARMNKEDAAVLDAVGIDFAHPKHLAGELLGADMPDGYVDQFVHLSLYMFTKSEYLNKGTAALAKYYQLKDAGVKKKSRIQQAMDSMFNTHFDYSLADTPGILRNPVGKAFAQFKQFPINQLFFANDVFRNGTRAQKARFALALWAMGGLAVFFYQTPLVWINKWTQGMAEDEYGSAQGLWDELLDHVPGPEWMQQGLSYGLWGLMGIDASQRVGFGGPGEFNSNIPGDKWRAVQRLLDSNNPTERREAMKALSPTILKNLWRMSDMANEGVARDRYGNIVNDDVSFGDVALKGFGLQSVEEGEERHRRNREYAAREDYSSKRSDYIDQAATLMRAGKLTEMGAILRKAREDGVNITVNNVRDQIERRDQDPVDRRIARTPVDLRDEMFSPQELQEYNSRHGSGSRNRTRPNRSRSRNR